MNLTFKEKSLLIQSVILVLLFGAYFIKVLPLNAQTISSEIVTQMIFMVIALVVLMIIGHILAVIGELPEASDERDKLIALKASQVSSAILASGVVIAIMYSLKMEGNFWSVHILLIALVLSEVTNKVLQLFFYRRGL